jgi:hypothetical protein
MIVHHSSKHINSSALNQTAASSIVICSKEDESRYMKDLEERNRKERIK